jgi:hypothetical protein
MGSGSLNQITKNNLVDNYLTGTPQITHFKAVYKRHTRFAIEAIEVTGNNEPSGLATSDQNVTYPIPVNGDLLSRVWIEANFSQNNTTDFSYVNWVNNTGTALIKESKVVIGGSGGSEIDNHESLWLDIWNELTDHEGKEHLGLNKHQAKNSYLKSNVGSLPNIQLCIPLQFWFNRNYGMALPLIAMKFSSLKIVNKYRALKHLINNSGDSSSDITLGDIDIKLFADFIYLDDDEKRRFAQSKHEYLIEVVDSEEVEFSSKVKFNFQLPVKELIWVIRSNERPKELSGLTKSGVNVDATVNTQATASGTTTAPGGVGSVHSNDLFNYTCGDVNSATSGNAVSSVNSGSSIFTSNGAEWFDNAKIQLSGGSDRFEPRKAVYFRTVQPYQAGHKIPSKHIYLYSFALNPEEQQYSGSCNFSLFENSTLSFNALSGNGDNATTNTISIFALHYNVLRIEGGKAGLAFSS